MKSRAFTLVELLVVIVIIALLLAILVPSLLHSRENANAIKCSSNIKQLLLVLTLYEIDNGAFPYAFDVSPKDPPPGGHPGDSGFDRIGWWWFNYIADYSRRDLDKDKILWCPSRQITNNSLEYNVLYGNYGVNQSVCKSSIGKESHAEFTGQSLCSSEMSNSSLTLLLVDSGYSMINWWHVTDTPPEPLGSIREDALYIPGLLVNRKKDLRPGLEDDAIHGRHANKTVNIGFSDGHCARENADNMLVEKIGETYLNKVPLWQPK